MAGLMFGIGLMVVVITIYIIKWIYIMIVEISKMECLSCGKGSVQS